MVSKKDRLSSSGIPRSSFSYKHGDGIRGRKASQMTVNRDGELIDNTEVVKEVEKYPAVRVLLLWIQKCLG